LLTLIFPSAQSPPFIFCYLQCGFQDLTLAII
jgi:hypothetical protein